MSKVKLLSEKAVYNTKYFDVFQTQVEVEGQERTYNYVSANNAVCILPITENGEIYLIKQYRYIFDNFYIEVISGFIDGDENPEVAAKRELLEETGLKAGKWIALGEKEMASSFLKFSQFYFIATDLEEGMQQLEDSEEIEVFKIPLDDAVEKVLSGEINNQKSIVGVLLANEVYKQENL